MSAKEMHATTEQTHFFFLGMMLCQQAGDFEGRMRVYQCEETDLEIRFNPVLLEVRFERDGEYLAGLGLYQGVVRESHWEEGEWVSDFWTLVEVFQETHDMTSLGIDFSEENPGCLPRD